MTDPIADMLTRMRNAIAAKHSRVDIPASKLKLEIARILKEEGYINNFVVKGEGPKRTLRIFLRYDTRGTSSILLSCSISHKSTERSTLSVGCHTAPMLNVSDSSGCRSGLPEKMIRKSVFAQ